MKTIIYILFLVFFILSCSTPLKKGLENFEQAKYQQAIGFFNQALEQGGDKGYINGLIAESYRKSNRLKEAETFYKNAIENKANDENLIFYYATALKTNGKYKEAKEALELYVKNGKNTELVRRAKAEIKDFEKIEQIKNTKTYYTLNNCEALNTAGDEFSPMPFNDKLVFSTTRKEVVYENTGGRFTGLFVTNLKDIEKDNPTIEVFSDKLYINNIHEASPTFSPDNTYVIFARSGAGNKGETNEVDLYISRKNTAGGWDEPEIMGYPININKNLAESGNQNLKGSTENAWTGCPFIRQDGKRLYFASNRKGGYGGLDIWIADIKGAKITNVRNAGKDINTSGDEMFPFVSNDGVLYFASNGHLGLGGLDLFAATFEKGSVKIKNLGVPINSNADDFALIWDTDSTGIMASNRDGGKGGDDLYRVRDITPKSKIVNYNLIIQVVGIDPTDKEKKETQLENAQVQLFEITELNKKTKINDFVTNKEGKTNKFPVKIHKDYIITAKAGDEYFFKEIEYTTRGKAMRYELLSKPETDTTLEAKVILEKIVISNVTYELEINFDFNKFDIRPDAARELDKFAIFLKDNPQIFIELASHTDAVGPADKNQILSQNRANSTKAYLVSKGIDEERIKAVGYGENKLKINTQEAEERNRRTEFQIIDVKKNNANEKKKEEEKD
jgi:outer membrane protein OmpA-like peptidoglycan-associated protein/Tol biopolymer transport system component